MDVAQKYCEGQFQWFETWLALYNAAAKITF